jgi:predicted membrane GTPase involved in stress response
MLLSVATACHFLVPPLVPWLQMLVANIDYDVHLGRIAIGRVVNGTIKKAQQVSNLEGKGRGTSQQEVLKLHAVTGH